MEKTSKNLSEEARAHAAKSHEHESGSVKGISGRNEAEQGGDVHAGNGIQRRGEPIKYHAPQILLRQTGDPARHLPIGTSFIGKLLTGIDTREPNGLTKVLIPYGAAFDHDRRIEKGSLIFGVVSYPGSGEKVYVKFNRLLAPNGQEFKIEAQALSSLDYSPGLYGEENDGAESRVGGAIGLSMFSGVTTAMVEKESLSQFGEPTPKVNLRNGLFNGLTKAANEEASRKAGKLVDVKDYVTIGAGSDVIVGLTETFRGEIQ